MEHGNHALLGEYSTGNILQPKGKHRENAMPRGMGLIPLGDRDRSKPEYNELEDRDSDPNIRRI